MTVQMITALAATTCGVAGACVYVFAYILRRAPFRLHHLIALCCNVIALTQIAASTLAPAHSTNLMFAAAFLGIATLVMSLSALATRRGSERP